MKYRIELPKKDRLLELFSYENGMLIHKHWKRFLGQRAGKINHYGYRVVKVDGTAFYEHRIIWVMLNKSLEYKDIDHINGIKDDNRIENLRAVDRNINNQNIIKPQVNNTTGFLGVTRRKNKFYAQICVDRKVKYLGVFDNPENAHQAYLQEKRKLHLGCTI